MTRKTKRTKRYRRTKKLGGSAKPVNYVLYLTVSAAIFAAAGLIFGIIQNYGKGAESDSISIYYYDAAAMTLKPELRPLPLKEHKDIVQFALEEIVVGPKNVALSPSVPPDIIKSATISGENVDLSMSGQYESLKPYEELICRTALAYTLTSLDFINSITISINGKELTKPNGQPFGTIEFEDLVLKPDMETQGESLKTIVLYFASAGQTKLVAENRSIMANPSEPTAKYIVEELIKGPVLSDLLPTVPPETVLLDISTSEGICYVDLSKEFVTKNVSPPPADLLSIYSIVNSLCEQSDIKKVQFYIEGERQEQFMSINDFSNLFEAKTLPLEDTE